jgi:hypothetical protein
LAYLQGIGILGIAPKMAMHRRDNYWIPYFTSERKMHKGGRLLYLAK